MSQLREHWEDTSQKVQARKSQLEELSVDHRHFEAKYQEIDAWLSRMEAWQSRLRPVGSTKEVLEQQTREQKVFKLVIYVYMYLGSNNTYSTVSKYMCVCVLINAKHSHQIFVKNWLNYLLYRS